VNLIKRWLLVAVSVVSMAGLTIAQEIPSTLSESFVDWSNHPAIQYRARPPSDPVADLNRKLRAGEVTMKGEGPSGYLRSVLDALQVPIDSQMMVFVKDSVQMGRISRDNPRALYFNDVVSVGWVRGGFIELASQDPRQGVIFYTLEESMLDVALDTVRRGRPSLTRRNDCLSCHHTYSSLGVPGLLNRSVGQFTVTQQLPFEQRWGGWFVTGDHGAAHHLGNAELSHIFDTPCPSGM